jgi:dipeptidyl aminopeptidase/acylaminoacyl peptidase
MQPRARANPDPISTTSPALTPTVFPTSTQTVEHAINPYTIEGLRSHSFKSGRIKIGSMLESNPEFVSYPIEYPSDDLKISGVLQIPTQGRPPYPVIILNHGYFYRGDYRSGDGTDRMAAYLNRHGYMTVSSDYRSWGRSEVGPSLFYSGLVIDVINLINALPSLSQADPGRLGMLGHSMGGGVTMKVLTIDSRIRAAVLYSTVSADDSDLIARWGAGCIGDVFESELLYGCNSSDILPASLPSDLLNAYQMAAYDPDMLRKVSSINYLANIKIPIQIGYGTDDGRYSNGTPPEWSKNLYAALIGAGVQAELFAYEGETHSFVGNEWVAFMERSSHFFDLHVK